MPFAFAFVGIVFIIAGARGTSSALVTLLKNDMIGTPGAKNSFIYWILAIAILGGLGYVDELRPLSRALLILVLIVLFLTEGNATQGSGGFFQKFQQAVGQITESEAA